MFFALCYCVLLVYVRFSVRAGAVRVRTLVLVCVYRLAPQLSPRCPGGGDKYAQRPPAPSRSAAAPVSAVPGLA